MKGGTVYGETDDVGYKAVDKVVRVPDFHARFVVFGGKRHRALCELPSSPKIFPLKTSRSSAAVFGKISRLRFVFTSNVVRGIIFSQFKLSQTFGSKLSQTFLKMLPKSF